METYEERQAAKRAQVAEDQVKANAIAGFMGSEWTAARPSWMTDGDKADGSVELHGPNDAIVFVRVNSWRNKRKGEASGRFTKAMYDSSYNPKLNNGEIGFSSEKSAEQIARDIVRRVLPVYLPELERGKVNAKRAAEYEAGKNALADRLAKIAGATNRDGHVYLSIGSLDVSGPDSVRFTIHGVDAATAERVVQALKVEQ